MSVNVSRLYYEYSQRASDAVQIAEVNLFVAQAIRTLIQMVFMQITTTFVVTLSSRYNITHFWYRDMMEKLYSTWGYSAVQLITFDKNNPVVVLGRRYCNLMLIDSFEALLDTDIVKHNSHYDSSEYYFIFLQTEDILIPAQLSFILEYCLQNFWIHCNVMIQTARAEVLVFTYFPYIEESCTSTEPILINQFNGQEWINKPMFPDKLDNMYGCSMKIITWQAPPFVEIFYRKNHSIEFGGFEMALVQILKDTMNFTMILVEPKVDKFFGQNATLVGPFELLSAREANMSLGYLRKTIERDFVATATFTHHYSPLVALILKNRYSSLEVLAFPFHIITWFAVFLSLITIVIFVGIFKLLQHDWLKKFLYRLNLPIVRIFLGIPIVAEPPQISNRLLVIALMLGTFVLRTVYQALLFHLIRTDLYRDAPRTYDALLEARYMALSTPHTVLILRDIPLVSGLILKYKTIKGTSDLEVFTELGQAMDAKYFAVISEECVRRFGPEKSLEIDFQVIPDMIKLQQLTIYLPKHSYFAEKFSKKILEFGSTGLIDALYRWQLNPKMKKVSNIYSEKLFGQHELIGIYMVMGVSFVIALIIFILEVLSIKFPILKKLF